MSLASQFNPHTPDGADIPAGISHYGITFPLGSGMGLTITAPWWFVALVGVGGYYAVRAISRGFH